MAQWDHDELRSRSPLPPLDPAKLRYLEAHVGTAPVAQAFETAGADAELRMTTSCPLDDLTDAPAAATVRRRLIETDSASRKTFPMCEGLLDYFPDALAEVARVSFVGNAKHNPGQPMHHARGKSMDHADCIVRHLIERGGFDVVVIDGVEHPQRHSASLAWRALALLQEEIEREKGLPMPRGAR